MKDRFLFIAEGIASLMCKCFGHKMKVEMHPSLFFDIKHTYCARCDYWHSEVISTAIHKKNVENVMQQIFGSAVSPRKPRTVLKWRIKEDRDLIPQHQLPKPDFYCFDYIKCTGSCKEQCDACVNEIIDHHTKKKA